MELNKKYTSVDIVFNIPVDADNPVDARKQANKKFRLGAVGCNICNTATHTTIIEDSIPEETLNNSRVKSSVIQELAHITGMAIYDNNSLEEAIKLILPSTKKIQKDKLRKVYDESDSIEYKMGIESAMDILDIYF